MNWNFDNSYSRLNQKLYTKTNPVAVEKPELVVLNQELAKSLGLNLANETPEKLAQIFSGNVLSEGTDPIAQAYAGHQFGHFVILGDGRAHLLGEQITPDKKRFDIQLKGSCRTPYSRGGDGRAALKPMLREYIISESMYALGIPTTRSLAVVKTGESVFRENILPGAILTRVASSHIRVGTFQYCRLMQDQALLKELADHVIQRHYPNLGDRDNSYLSLLEAVMERQVSLICEWMRVGFVHGVMNTDNMSICGETIDYGPCAFMDKYQARTVFSSIDSQGRYAFGNQPAIAKWNLTRFAESILPLISEEESKAIDLAESILNSFDDLFSSSWLQMMRKKIGLFENKEEDRSLINQLLKIMEEKGLDYTQTFYELTKFDSDFLRQSLPQDWLSEWKNRLRFEGKMQNEVSEAMQKVNPNLIPRNSFVEEALKDAEDNNVETMNNFLTAISNSYDASKIDKKYKNLPLSDPSYKTFCGT